MFGVSFSQEAKEKHYMSHQSGQNHCDRYSAEKAALEAACRAIAPLMRQWLQQKTINAQEFLSVIGNLPVRSSDAFPPKPRKS